MEQKSLKEDRIRKITHLYYSRPDVQKAIFEFSQDREICPRYFEGFGKRPDFFQYKGDIFELVKKGATSFHCSEELWDNPLNIITGMTEEQANELRIGWDLLIDVDCKWFDYSKLAAQAIIKVLENHQIKNIGIKFSGSKGWHILIPWKSFPKEIGNEQTKDLFPELPRKIVDYIRFKTEEELTKNLPADFEEQFKNVKIKKGIKCNQCKEIANEFILTDFFCEDCGIGEHRKLAPEDKTEFKCPNCRQNFEVKNSIDIYECNRCNIDSGKNQNNFSQTIETDIFEVMGLDLLLVSPRHLFRMPYSLHEKTALASMVLNKDEVLDFELKDADSMSIQIKNFMPDSEEGEAKELVMQAVDWDRENKIFRGESEEKVTGKYAEFKPIKLDRILEENFPPCVKRILNGLADGRKRTLFVLINLFRSVGMDKEELEKKINEWNTKNEVPLKKGYIISQLLWSYKRKPIMPQNCRTFYQDIGICTPDEFCPKIKNPVNYVVRKSFVGKKKERRK